VIKDSVIHLDAHMNRISTGQQRLSILGLALKVKGGSSQLGSLVCLSALVSAGDTSLLPLSTGYLHHGAGSLRRENAWKRSANGAGSAGERTLVPGGHNGTDGRHRQDPLKSIASFPRVSPRQLLKISGSGPNQHQQRDNTLFIVSNA
jgi:hypothetical protein